MERDTAMNNEIVGFGRRNRRLAAGELRGGRKDGDGMTEQIGTVGVDAGMLLISDPCYVLHREGKPSMGDIGKDWDEFCDITTAAERQSNGICDFGAFLTVSNFGGDGEFPVYVKRNRNGLITELRVVFDGGHDESECSDY